MEHFITFAPTIIVVTIYLIQQRIIVTPEQLERKHREILSDIEHRFASMQTVNDLKTRLDEMNEKIDKIYEYIITG